MLEEQSEILATVRVIDDENRVRDGELAESGSRDVEIELREVHVVCPFRSLRECLQEFALPDAAAAGEDEDQLFRICDERFELLQIFAAADQRVGMIEDAARIEKRRKEIVRLEERAERLDAEEVTAQLATKVRPDDAPGDLGRQSAHLRRDVVHVPYRPELVLLFFVPHTCRRCASDQRVIAARLVRHGFREVSKIRRAELLHAPALMADGLAAHVRRDEVDASLRIAGDAVLMAFDDLWKSTHKVAAERLEALGRECQ
ncbi:MAG TPA: hypothetical protein VJZ00_11250 [Thermoanaerobaculia bacterium]|nr:hypothetical protein [Thermoanaerobaculia bacterium]